ncbi:DnaJ-like protein subfamily C member 17 [Trichoplax sp. H2]|nr:DnaJ-like protein subfamily C member 17 [Trichoplax sp. H2]|eukprot:RDD44356.1 DnaJ-like protein subfamily C member 17 [Trichoplax sp. H2]
MGDITNIDLYQFLGVPDDSTEKEILTAYRKKAIKCHPDKNPDNPAAAETFIKLSKAVEILTDKAAKISYDRLRKARKAKEKRDAALDATRKKFKQDLEERERSVRDDYVDEAAEAKKLRDLVERIRADGSRKLEEEKEMLRKQIETEIVEKAEAHDNEQKSYTLKVRWNSAKSADANPTYDYDTLMEIFRKFGTITNLVISGKKKGLALVEFSSYLSAHVLSEQESLGSSSDPLRISWVGDKPTPSTKFNRTPFSSESANFSNPGLVNDRDYESLTLMRLRQAEERKRLEEQIATEDD